MAASARKRLVIFDCDGTLVDSQNAIVTSMEYAYRVNGLEPPARAHMLSVVGLSLPEAFYRLLPDQSPTLARRVSDAYRDAFGHLRLDPAHHEPLFEGAREAVLRLATCGRTRLGVATGKSTRGVRALFDRERWHPHFHTVQTADTAPSKPHPGMVLQALAETGIERRDAVMIGDTSFDMAMAKAAGVHAIGVAWGYHPLAELHAAGADIVVENFDQLLQVIDERLSG
jgi:phosphoglycolate phosphatase